MSKTQDELKTEAYDNGTEIWESHRRKKLAELDLEHLIEEDNE